MFTAATPARHAASCTWSSTRGGDSRFDTPYFLDGGNRAGRSEEVKAELLGDLMGAFQEITGVASEDFGGRITEGPAKWTMEGGMVLPEPGEETEEWYSHGQAAAGG